MSWSRNILDLVYPRNCAGCGRASVQEERYLCWDCQAQIPFITFPFCSHCGNPVEGAVDHEYLCIHCTRSRPHFDAARCAARFDGPLKEMIHQLKYGRALWLAQDLAALLEACVMTHYADVGFSTVISVPLHPARKRDRGYNQADLLARALARRLDLPYDGGVLRRVKPTPTQTNLTARDRANNVAGAFETRRISGVAGCRLLLVDDVMTTGATLSECSKALKNAGAAGVHVVALARRS